MQGVVITVALSEECRQLRRRLLALEQRRGELLDEINKPALEGRPSSRQPSSQWTSRLQELTQEIRQLQSEIARRCTTPIEPPRPFPLSIFVSAIQCVDGPIRYSPTELEPYLLVFVLNFVPFPPAPKVVKVAWTGVEPPHPFRFDGLPRFYGAPPNVLWGVDGNPAPIADPDDALLIAALVENDETDPDLVRLLVENQMDFAFARNSPSLAFGRDEFARRMVDAMTGAVDVATTTAFGFPNPDDPIGDPQRLRITAWGLRRVFDTGIYRMQLTFTSSDLTFNVSFMLRRR
jgi:hypothetical protein